MAENFFDANFANFENSFKLFPIFFQKLKKWSAGRTFAKIPTFFAKIFVAEVNNNEQVSERGQ